MNPAPVKITPEVILAIQGELQYQAAIAGTDRADNKDHGLPGQLVALSAYLHEANRDWAKSAGDLATMETMRKIAAIAVKCLVLYGCPKRDHPSAEPVWPGDYYSTWTVIFPGKMGIAWKRAWDGEGTQEEARLRADQNCNAVAVPIEVWNHIDKTQRELVAIGNRVRERVNILEPKLAAITKDLEEIRIKSQPEVG